MSEAPNIADLYTALALAQGEFPTIEKGSINPHYKSKYADLADINKATTPSLSKHGLCIIQLIQPNTDKAIIKTMLCHKSGASIDSTIEIVPVTKTPQGMGSAYTYARRYGIQAMLNISAEEDDDGNAASKQNEANVKTPEQPRSSIVQLDEYISAGIKAGFKTAIDKYLKDNNINIISLTEEEAEQVLISIKKERQSFKKD